jgi:hypothetical protein
VQSSVVRKPLMAICLAALTAVASCRSGSPSAGPSSSGPSSSPAVPASTLDCAKSAQGDLGPDWRRRAERVGPLYLLGVMRGTAGPPQPNAPIIFHKVLLVVEAGQRVTMTIPEELRGDAALIYEPRRDPTIARAIGDGVSGLTFHGCPDRDTQFPGGFLIRRGMRGLTVEIGNETVSLTFGRPMSSRS